MAIFNSYVKLPEGHHAAKMTERCRKKNLKFVDDLPGRWRTTALDPGIQRVVTADCLHPAGGSQRLKAALVSSQGERLAQIGVYPGLRLAKRHWTKAPSDLNAQPSVKSLPTGWGLLDVASRRSWALRRFPQWFHHQQPTGKEIGPFIIELK